MIEGMVVFALGLLFVFWMIRKLSNRVDTDPKRFFMASMVCIAIWIVADLATLPATLSTAQIMMGVSSLAISLATTSFFLSCVSFTNRIKAWHFVVSMIPTIVMFMFLFGLEMEVNPLGGYAISYTPLLDVWMLSLLLIVGWGILTLFNINQTLSNKALKKKINYFSVGIILTMMLPIGNVILMRFMPLPDFSSALSTIGLFVAYQAFKK